MELCHRYEVGDSTLVLTGLNLVRTDCCGLVANDGGVGAPMYILESDEALIHQPIYTHPTDQEIK